MVTAEPAAPPRQGIGLESGEDTGHESSRPSHGAMSRCVPGPASAAWARASRLLTGTPAGRPGRAPAAALPPRGPGGCCTPLTEGLVAHAHFNHDPLHRASQDEEEGQEPVDAEALLPGHPLQDPPHLRPGEHATPTSRRQHGSARGCGERHRAA